MVQDGNGRPFLEIVFNVIAGDLDQPKTKLGGSDQTFCSIHCYDRRKVHIT